MENFSGLIIAGKMHGAGVDEPVASEESVKSFLDAGADVILVPAVGTSTVAVLPEEICNFVDSISAPSSTGSKFTPIGRPVNFWSFLTVSSGLSIFKPLTLGFKVSNKFFIYLPFMSALNKRQIIEESKKG